jgi:hypothetical protein
MMKFGQQAIEADRILLDKAESLYFTFAYAEFQSGFDVAWSLA